MAVAAADRVLDPVGAEHRFVCVFQRSLRDIAEIEVAGIHEAVRVYLQLQVSRALHRVVGLLLHVSPVDVPVIFFLVKNVLHAAFGNVLRRGRHTVLSNLPG